MNDVCTPEYVKAVNLLSDCVYSSAVLVAEQVGFDYERERKGNGMYYPFNEEDRLKLGHTKQTIFIDCLLWDMFARRENDELDWEDLSVSVGVFFETYEPVYRTFG